MTLSSGVHSFAYWSTALALYIPYVQIQRIPVKISIFFEGNGGDARRAIRRGRRLVVSVCKAYLIYLNVKFWGINVIVEKLGFSYVTSRSNKMCMVCSKACKRVRAGCAGLCSGGTFSAIDGTSHHKQQCFPVHVCGYMHVHFTLSCT